MSKVYGDVDLQGGGKVLNLSAEHLSADPAFDSADEGVVIYNTTDKTYKYNNGSAWVAFEVSLTSSAELVETLGSNWINDDFSFDPTDFNILDNIDGLTADDNLFTVIAALDAGVTDAKTVTTLQGVDLDFEAGDLSSGNVVFFNGTNFVPGTVNDLDTVELTMGELSDASVTDPEDLQFMVQSAGEWVNRPIFFKYEELSGTLSTFTVNHSLNEQFCHVTIIDMGFSTPRRIDPSEIVSVEYNTDTTLTVTTTGIKAVTIIVSTVQGLTTA